MIRNQKSEGRKQKSEAVPLRIAFLFISVFCFLLSDLGVAGAFRSSKHGDPLNGPQRRNEYPRGSCMQCHDGLHASHATPPQGYAHGLFAPDNNDLCFTCHALPTAVGIYPGNGPWLQSSHAISPNVYLPGTPGRPSSDANKCVNCHEPHGVIDTNGAVPAMLVERDATLCIHCHDGSRARDIRREFTKSYRHPTGTLKHRPGESTPADFASRHAECVDCHNAHKAGTDPAPPSPPQASARLAGVSRVQVANGGAGSVPNYMWRGADDTTLGNEYEICFKCHSSFTTQIPGQSNLALLTNPANPSTHPIQGPGKNANIDMLSFANGYTATSMIFCSDCHASDDPSTRGPHGSSYQYILKKPSSTMTAPIGMQQTDLCFDCHAYSVYGDPTAIDVMQRPSRFNAPANVRGGHAYHTGTLRYTCYVCHETHGSTRRPALIATRLGAITTYTQTPTGGSCVAACHNTLNPRTYTLNYPR